MDITYYNSNGYIAMSILRAIAWIYGVALSAACIIMLDITIGIVMGVVYITTIIIHHFFDCTYTYEESN